MLGMLVLKVSFNFLGNELIYFLTLRVREDNIIIQYLCVTYGAAVCILKSQCPCYFSLLRPLLPPHLSAELNQNCAQNYLRKY